MSINIFQFLKQGTSLSSSTLKKNSVLEQKVTPKEKTPNAHYLQTGKFIENGENKNEQQEDNGDWEELNQQSMKNQFNRKMQKSAQFRKKYKIKVTGDDVPFLCLGFDGLRNRYGIQEGLMEGLAMIGVSKPTPVQMQTIPALIQDRNVLVTAPTGTGKTLSYLLPIVHNLLKNKKSQPQSTPKKKQVKKLPTSPSPTSPHLSCLIIAPQQELSSQISHQLSYLTMNLTSDSVDDEHKKRISHRCISQFSEEEIQNIVKDRSFGVDILVATPQLFLNVFQKAKGDKKMELIKNVRYVILDECDKYFEQSFLSQIQAILEIFSTLKTKPTYGLFSATIQHQVQQLLKSQLLDNALQIQIGGKNKTLKNIEQSIQYCTNQYGKILELKNMIAENRFVPPALIFVQEKIRAKQLLFQVKKIMKDGPGGLDLSKKVQVLTGEKSKQERKEILDKFQKGTFLILITTDIIARGIDFSHVNLVINYDFPNTMLTYIHRVGRTGRAERTGTAVTFFTEQDKPIVKSLANLLNASGCKVPEWLLQLPNVDRKIKKKLQKFPTKRLPVGVAEGRDKNFDKELQKMQRIWQNKKNREAQKQKKQKAAKGDDEQQSQWIQA